MQTELLSRLARFVTRGVVFATHSVGLARTVASTVISVQKTGNRSSCAELAATPRYAEFAGELNFSASRDLGFDELLLVEGPTDVLVVMEWLRTMHKDHKVVVMQLGGASMIRGDVDVQLSELLRVTSRVSALVDSERQAAGAPGAASHEAFAELCRKLEIRVCLTERRATENYFTARAVELQLPGVRPLQPYELLRDHKCGWSKAANWQIARHMTVEELEATDVGQFLRDL